MRLFLQLKALGSANAEDLLRSLLAKLPLPPANGSSLAVRFSETGELYQPVGRISRVLCRHGAELDAALPPGCSGQQDALLEHRLGLILFVWV